VTPVRRWIRMPHSSTSYDFASGLTADSHGRYIADAVAAADPTVNFAGYQLYYFVVDRNATAISYSPAFIFGRTSDITADGATIGHGATFGVDAYYWGFKVLNHETSHAFGLPDLYNANGLDDLADQHKFVGGWDVMGLISGHAPDYLAWQKFNLGWIASSQIACLNLAGTTDVTLTPLETAGGTKAVVLRTGPKTVTVAEYRTAQGIDDAACATGVLVSTVNNALASGLGLVRVRDAHPGAVAAGCELPLDDAPFTASDAAFTDAASGITIRVLSLGDTARIRVTRTKAWTPSDVRNARSLTIDAVPSGNSALFSGLVTASPAWSACRNAVAVQLQKYRSGAWVTVRTTTTTSTGAWSATINWSAGEYRALAAQVIVGSRPRHICLTTTSESLLLN
jgi:M6 family metalloprotease-like protein